MAISAVESNTKHPGMETDLGGGSINFERHGLDIAVQYCQSAVYGLSQRP